MNEPLIQCRACGGPIGDKSKERLVRGHDVFDGVWEHWRPADCVAFTAKTAEIKCDALRAQCSEARARVVGLEAQLAEVTLCLRHFGTEGMETALAALSADPLEIGKAALEATELLIKVLDVIDTQFHTVLGLPCICDSPELHADECVVVRDACMKRDRLATALKGDR